MVLGQSDPRSVGHKNTRGMTGWGRGDSLAVLEEQVKGKVVVDKRGRLCGDTCGVRNDYIGNPRIIVKWRTMLGLLRHTLVPAALVDDLDALKLVLPVSLRSFRQQIWRAREDYKRNYYEHYPFYDRGLRARLKWAMVE